MALPKLPNVAVLKKNLPLIIAAVSALAAVFLINIYIQQQSEAAKKRVLEAERNQVTVVLAAKDIPRGAKITEEMLEERRGPKNKVPPQTATSIGRVISKVALAPIQKGQLVSMTNLGTAVQKERWEPLSAKIPPGKRAVTIPVDNISSVGGMIIPGDSVDLMGLVSLPALGSAQKLTTSHLTTLPLLQNILVLAVGQEINPVSSAGKRTSASTVTLALTPQEASIIAFIQEQGKIRMALRSPADKQALRGIPADWDTVLKLVLPQQSGEGAIKPKRTVEIYHGAKKEIRNIE